MKTTIAFLVLLTLAPQSFAQTPYGSCPDRAQRYQERYEQDGQARDLVCYQTALQREMTGSSGRDCPLTAQYYQTRYESDGRSDDLVCYQQALQRELHRR